MPGSDATEMFMDRLVVRGLVVAALIALVTALVAVAAGYGVVAPMAFLGFILAVIFAAIFATTSPTPRA